MVVVDVNLGLVVGDGDAATVCAAAASSNVNKARVAARANRPVGFGLAVAGLWCALVVSAIIAVSTCSDGLPRLRFSQQVLKVSLILVALASTASFGSPCGWATRSPMASRALPKGAKTVVGLV